MTIREKMESQVHVRILYLLFFSLCVRLSSCNNVTTLANLCYYTLDGQTPLFECDFTLLTLPLTFSDFTPQPQRLRIFNVNGQMPASVPTATFSGFSAYDTATRDSNYPASLDIQCTSGGTLILFTNTFADLGYIEELTITNCVLSGGLPNDIFSDFVELNSLIIDGGSIASLTFGSLNGLNITDNLNVPNAKGLFVMSNLALSTTSFPGGFFYPINQARSIILDNIATPTTDYMSIPTDTFNQNKALKVLSLSYLNVTYIENNIFSAHGSLSYLNLTGMKWACSCDTLTWFLDFVKTNQIEIIGGMVCDTPSDYQNQRATAYHNAVCPKQDACGDITGAVMFGSCFPWWQLFNYALLVVTFLISALALGLIIATRLSLRSARMKLQMKQKSSWEKVQEALKRGGGGQKPPASTGPPKGSGWM